MNTTFFSIIVPVYNGMPFVNICLENLCGQTFTDIEIILIDDGSTDGSIDVCKQYQSIDDRISFLSNGHHGVSNARNCGLQRAKGEWILFIDCDDVYSKDTLMTLKHIIELNNDVDLISGIFSRIDTDGHQLSIYPHKKVGSFTFGEYVSNGAFYPAGACGHCLRHSILRNNNLKFCTDLTVAEDALFMVHYCAYIKRVVLTDDVIYQYRVNPHSTMKSKGTVEKTESQLSAAVMMYDSKELGDEDYKKLTVLRAYNTVSIAILNAAQSHYSLKELISLYKSVCAKSEYMGYLSKKEIIYKYILYKMKEKIKSFLHI